MDGIDDDIIWNNFMGVTVPAIFRWQAHEDTVRRSLVDIMDELVEKLLHVSEVR